MILDHDSELAREVASRARRRGWESHALGGLATKRLLARMRIDALLVDPAAIEFDRWGWLARTTTGLPGLAVVVAAGPSTVGERIHALRSGVDDWLDKPSHPDELIERIAGAVRRRRHAAPELTAGEMTAGRLKIDATVRRVFVGDAPATGTALTARELGVLKVLMAGQGLVVEREKVFVRVWGYTMVPGDRSVDVHVRKIRAKLREISPGWEYIHTQFRIGYRFQPERVAD